MNWLKDFSAKPIPWPCVLADTGNRGGCMGNKDTGSARHQKAGRVSSSVGKAVLAKAEKGIKTAAIIRPFFTRWLQTDRSSSTVNDAAGESCKILKFDAKVDSQSVQARIDECHQKLTLLDSRQSEMESVRLRRHTETVLIRKRLQRAVYLQQSAMQRLGREHGRGSGDVLEQSYRNFEMQTALLKQKHSDAKVSLDDAEQELQQVSEQIQSQTALLQQLIIDNNGLQQAA